MSIAIIVAACVFVAFGIISALKIILEDCLLDRAGGTWFSKSKQGEGEEVGNTERHNHK